MITWKAKTLLPDEKIPIPGINKWKRSEHATCTTSTHTKQEIVFHFILFI